MEEYVFDYKNEKKFKKLEKDLKKCNPLAFKKLYFEVYPKLKAGEFIGHVVKEEGNIMEYVLDLPTDALFAKTYGEVKLHYEVDEDSESVTLITFSPEDAISEQYQSKPFLTTDEDLEFIKRLLDIVNSKNVKKDVKKDFLYHCEVKTSLFEAIKDQMKK